MTCFAVLVTRADSSLHPQCGRVCLPIIPNTSPDRVSYRSIVPCWHRTPQIEAGLIRGLELISAELHSNISVTEHWGHTDTSLFISGFYYNHYKICFQSILIPTLLVSNAVWFVCVCVHNTVLLWVQLKLCPRFMYTNRKASSLLSGASHGLRFSTCE